MKTASKLLSMLLLVAMCLSLMGGSAYATGLAPLGEAATQGLAPLGTDDSSTVSGSTDSGAAGSSTFDLKPLSDDADSSTTFDLDKPSLYLSPDLFWSVGEGNFASLEEAVAAAKAGDTITMLQDAALNASTSINKNITLNLNGKTLSLAADLVIDANVTLSNGTVKFNGKSINVQNGRTLSVYTITCHPAGFATSGTGKVQLYSGTYSEQPKAEFLPDGYVWNSTTHEVGPKSATYVAYVNDKGYESVDEAFEAAMDLTGAVTISLVEDKTTFAELTLSGPVDFAKCDRVTINLNNNTLVANISTVKPMVINGHKLKGTVGTAISSLTLNANVEGSAAAAVGGTLTVNGVSVDEVEISEDSTLNMASGSIGKLSVIDGANRLNVTGGTIGTSTTPVVLEYDTVVAAIRGGTWYVNDADLIKFDALVADGYERSGDASPYTVVSKSGSGSGSGGTDNGFTYTLYGSPYTKNSTGTVYVDISAQSTNGYWIGTKADATNAQQISSLNYSLSANGTGYRLTFTNSYLNSLASGTYYLFAVYGGNTVRMCSTTNPLVITGSGSITVNPGTAAVWPVDSSLWYSGDGTYYFYVTPSLQLVDGKTYDYYDVRIDDVLLGGDKYTYNGYQKFGIAASVMDNLTVGNTHTLTVLTPAGYASCNFRIGATLRPVDTDKHVTGSSKNLQFVCSDAISRVWIGSNELTSLNYGDYWTLSSSGKTITLTAKLMNTQLVAGNTYTLTVQTANGDTPSCSFKILTTAQASASPQTGDESNLALWAAVLVLTGGAAVAILPRLKKHEN